MLYYATTKGEVSKLFIFSFLLVILTYGFALTNFTVTIDNEMPVLPDFGMDFGRWGQNLIRYHLFNGHLQYFSLLLSLFLFAIAAVRLANLFQFKGLAAYFFCGLFLTFPQLSYQVVFSIMADVAAFGVLLAVICVELIIEGFSRTTLSKKLIFFSTAAVILMFMLSIYQAFIVVPTMIYLIYFFQNTFKEGFSFKAELLNIGIFSCITIAGGVLYVISVKIICPPIQNSEYLTSFISGSADNQFLYFCSIWFKNLVGSFYYGGTAFIVALLAAIVLIVKFFIDRRLALLRFATLLAILLLPFILSAFITNGYHPPRLYLTANLVFAFVIVFALNYLKAVSYKFSAVGVVVIFMLNMYYVTNLFNSVHKIYNHDRRIAEKIDDIIQNKYPAFATGDKTVYFYGYFPYEYHQYLRLDKSEIFGGSFYNWDNGSNYRIVNFLREAGVADYKMLNTKEQLNSIQDSIPSMPVWPNHESVKMINNIIVVKLGNEKGSPLNFE